MGKTARNAIEIENLTVYYQNVCALSNINLKVKDREFVGIIGPNGGGKSTLLKSILGLIRPYEGKIRIYNKAPDRAHGLIGYVPQFSKFNRDFPIT
ncbi:MAG: ATP-binding cassette domain-containing protein, partial [Tissierellales bacterium]